MGATRFRPWLGVGNQGNMFAPTAAVEVAAYEALTGTHADVAIGFLSFDTSYNAAHVAALNARGTAVMLTISPPDSGTGSPDPTVLEAVNAGTYDDALGQTARFCKGQNILIRPMHEMNGNFNKYGQQPAAYLAAWDRVRGIFRSNGNMAPFAWTPNITSVNADAIAQYYPGDSACEIVGIDGYSYPLEGSRSLADVFGGDLATLATLADRPRLIGEAGRSNLSPGSRAEWMRDGFDWLVEQDNIIGFQYWDRDEFALAGSPTAAGRLGAGMRAWRRSVAGQG